MRNKIFKITFFLAAVLLISSCLKDKQGEDWTSSLKGKMYAEVWKAGFLATGLKSAPDTVEFKFLVNIASDALPTSDITLTIGVNDEARTLYNDLKGTAYQLYPYIEVLNPTVVIKAGTRNAYVHVRVWNANTLDACDNFMAPISILTATGGVIVSDALNNGSRLMALPISNPYQGTYHVTGEFIHPTAGTRVIDEDKVLSTVDCKTVLTTVGDLGAYDLYIQVNSDNSVTITGGGNGISELVQDTSKPNVYDPVAKTFTLNYYYPGSGGNRVMSEVYTRL